jgi:hypothetical protein
MRYEQRERDAEHERVSWHDDIVTGGNAPDIRVRARKYYGARTSASGSVTWKVVPASAFRSAQSFP